MKTTLTLLFAVICSTFGFSQTYTLDSTVLTSRVVANGLDIPWEIIWGPDDHIWCTERSGRVNRIDPVTGSKTVVLSFHPDSIAVNSESGLLGMVLHPNFPSPPYVYLVYTYFDVSIFGTKYKEKLVRYTYTGSALVAPKVLIDDIKGNPTHIGSRLILLKDNTLLMSTGDAQITDLPQDINSLNGKILRLNLDGTIPSDNPIPGSYVYSWGHRNPQGLCDAPNGNIYISEHGAFSDDELQISQKAGNYGWPTVEGYCDESFETNFCNDSNVVEPIKAWTPTIAPSDIIWYDSPAIPEFKDKLLLTTLKTKKLIAIDFNNAGTEIENETDYLTNDLGRLRDICISPDGAIYLATNGASWTNNTPFTHEIIELKNLSYVTSSQEELQLNLNVELWPNPAEGNNLINFTTDYHGELTFVLYDNVGRQVFSENFTGNASFNPNLSNGIYTWVAFTKEGKSNQGKIQFK